MTPEQKLFQIELDSAARKLERPCEPMRSSIRYIIEMQLKVFNEKGPFVTQSKFNPEARESRSFEGECEVLTKSVVSNITVNILNTTDPVVLKEISVNAELKLSLIKTLVGFVYSEVIPQLEALPQPGDPFAVWTDSATKYKDFFKYAVESEARHSRGPYDDLSGWLAILGLVIQARRHHARGELEQAWLSLTDAMFFAGAQRGSSIARLLRPEVVKKQRAMDSSSRSRESLTKLKHLVVSLYAEKRPPEGWKNASVAADEIYLTVSDVARQDFKATEKRKAAKISRKTVYDLCRALQRRE